MKNLLCYFLVFILSAGVLSAWTEKGDRIKRQRKAQATERARKAIAKWKAEQANIAEAQRLASLGSLNFRNYESYFNIEKDDFEKFCDYFPKIVYGEALTHFPETMKFMTERGFFAPFARVSEEKFSCAAKVVLQPETPRSVDSVVFLFDDGETVKLPREKITGFQTDAKYSTTPLNLNVTGTGKISGTGNGTFFVNLDDLRNSNSNLSGTQNFRFEGDTKQEYTVTGTLPETHVTWYQRFYIPISEEVLEKISTAKQVRVRFYLDGGYKSDRTLSPVEQIAFRTVSKLKAILRK